MRWAIFFFFASSEYERWDSSCQQTTIQQLAFADKMRTSASNFLNEDVSSVEEIFRTEENHEPKRDSNLVMRFLRTTPILLLIGHVALSSVKFVLTKRGDQQHFREEVSRSWRNSGTILSVWSLSPKCILLLSMPALQIKSLTTFAPSSKATYLSLMLWVLKLRLKLPIPKVTWLGHL